MFNVFKYLYGKEAKCGYDNKRKVCIVDYVDCLYVGYRNGFDNDFIKFHKQEELSIKGMKRAYASVKREHLFIERELRGQIKC